jgi:hypothetical protein
VRCCLLEGVCYSSFFPCVDFLVLPNPSVLQFVGPLVLACLPLSNGLPVVFGIVLLPLIELGIHQAGDDVIQAVIPAYLCTILGELEQPSEHKKHCLTGVLDMKHLVDQGEDFERYYLGVEAVLGLKREGPEDLGTSGLVLDHAVRMGHGEENNFAESHLSYPLQISETLVLGRSQVVVINLFGFAGVVFVVVVEADPREADTEVDTEPADLWLLRLDLEVDTGGARLAGQVGLSQRTLDLQVPQTSHSADSNSA